MTSQARQKLGVDADYRPWISRSQIILKGCSKQQHESNFLWELLDIRWMRFVRQAGLSDTDDAPSFLFTDARQNVNRQLRSGSMSLLTSSLPYWHAADRVAIPLECFLHNGWDQSIKLASINEPVSEWPVADEKVATSKKKQTGPVKPRRQQTTPQDATATANLAANGMALPDLCLVLYTSILTISDLWEHAADWTPDPSNVHEARDVELTVFANCRYVEKRMDAASVPGGVRENDAVSSDDSGMASDGSDEMDY